MRWEMLSGLVRHGLTFAGGYAVTSGYVSQSEMELGVGATVTLIGIIWSAMDKRGRRTA